MSNKIQDKFLLKLRILPVAFRKEKQTVDNQICETTTWQVQKINALKQIETTENKESGNSTKSTICY
jgi:hypothetical protein